MKEILFKAKRKNSEEWVKGYYIGCIAGCYFLLTQDREEVLIDVETLSQYTGLKDVNGAKIFENDIVRLTFCDGVEIGTIKYSDTDFRFKFHYEDSNTCYGFDDTCIFEVIGNRFDNPELLHGKE